MLSLALLLLQAPAPPAIGVGLQPFLRAHCTECHSGAHPKGDMNLAAWPATSAQSWSDDMRETMERVRDRLLLGEMPPPLRPRPTDAELDAALLWLEANLPRPTVERPTLRRLNRSEYERTVRDLFGVSYPTREYFPADDVGAVFDNDAAVATASELAVERWVEAAERVAARALPPLADSTTRRMGPSELKFSGGVSRHPSELAMFSNGKAFASFQLPRDGLYRIERQSALGPSGY